MESLIFISHKESEKQLASMLVEFLIASLDLDDQQIRCTSVPGHQLPFGSTIPEQLKKDINSSSAVVVLLTQESLRSKWVLFEIGASWALGKTIVPILGSGLTHSDLPGPLENYPSVQIESDDASYRLKDSVSQMAKAINISEKPGGKAYAKLDSFITSFRDWPTESIGSAIDQVARVSLVQDIEESISKIFKQKTAHVHNEIDNTTELHELRFVLDNVPPWKFVADENKPTVAGWPSSKSILIDGQRHWLIRERNEKIEFMSSQYIASQSLQESLLWFRRVRKAHEAGVLIGTDLVDLWRFILPYGFSGRLHYFSRYFQGVEEVSAMVHVINNTLLGCCDSDMRTSLHYFQSYATEQDREILTRTKQDREIHKKIAVLGG